MANDFDDVRLSEDIERGATGGPGFKTTVITLTNGSEQRNQEWSRARGKYNIGYGIQKREQLERIYAFFHARRGMARGFRFRDWNDFQAKASPVGSVFVDNEAIPDQRQLVRIYDDEIIPYIRFITRPVVGTLRVYVDNIATDDYILIPGGILNFPSDPGPNVLVDYEYDIPVRFDIDDLNVKLNTYKEGSIPSIMLIELSE